MKNKTPVMNQSNRIQVPDWLYQDVQEDDFLSGKVPQEIQYAWEDEE